MGESFSTRSSKIQQTDQSLPTNTHTAHEATARQVQGTCGAVAVYKYLPRLPQRRASQGTVHHPSHLTP